MASTTSILRTLPGQETDWERYNRAILDDPVPVQPVTRRPPSFRPRPPGMSVQEALDAEDVDPETWRQIKLTAHKPDENICEVSLIRPMWWIRETGARVGGTINLHMPEVGVVGPADVLYIGPCPPLEESNDARAAIPRVLGGPEFGASEGSRRPRTELVTGTFKHHGAKVINVFVAGLERPIGTTPSHPFYSVDRRGWVRAGELRPGEVLGQSTGPPGWTGLRTFRDCIPSTTSKSTARTPTSSRILESSSTTCAAT